MQKMNKGTKMLRAMVKNHGDKKNLAEEIGITQMELSHILSGRRRPTLEQAIKLKMKLKIHIEYWKSTGERGKK